MGDEVKGLYSLDLELPLWLLEFEVMWILSKQNHRKWIPPKYSWSFEEPVPQACRVNNGSQSRTRTRYQSYEYLTA